MLVLSRKVGERILVGEQVRITVVRVTNGGVRLGIEAPDGTTVVREELTLKAVPQDQAAAHAIAADSNGASARTRPSKLRHPPK